jgi:hypothetical protein
MTFSRHDLDLRMGPHEALHLVEDLIDTCDIGRNGGKSEEGALAKILVIQFCRGDTESAAGSVEEVM